MDNLAKRVKTRRKELGLSQAELADSSGLQQSDISKIENGAIQKTTGIIGLATALRCDPSWLATGEGSRVSERVWPFALLTPDQVQALPPKLLGIVENLALVLLEVPQTRPAPAESLPDTGFKAAHGGLVAKHKKPGFLSDGSSPAVQATPMQRKARGGGSHET